MPRYKKGSTYQVQQRYAGLDPGHPRPWTNEEIDVVLNLHFDGVAVGVICREVGRTSEAVKLLLGRLISTGRWRKYPSAANYQPTQARCGRVGKWTVQELDVLKKLRGDVGRAALLLARSEQQISEQLGRLGGGGFFN